MGSTVIEGYEPGNNSNGNVMNNGGMYSRGGAAQGQGTVVSGMMGEQVAAAQGVALGACQGGSPQMGQGAQQRKPLLGFAYSVSRSTMGEFWPLYMGRNTIGRAADNDIVLKEATVSEHHAEIVIQMLRNPVKAVAMVRDAASTAGTLLNGYNVFGSQTPECHSGDVVTVGEHYELYVVLIDPASLGLQPVAGFMPVEEQVVAGGRNPNRYIPEAPASVYAAQRPSTGTVVDGQGMGVGYKGGTVVD